MEIKSYNAHELRELVASPDFGRLKHLPISRLRAASYLNNPRILPDKKMLFVAWIDDEVAAYRLMLPDRVYLNGQPETMAWFSCVWVDPEKRGLGLAKKLVTQALEEWGEYIMGADPVVASKTLYEQHYGFEVPAIEGTRLYFRFNMAELIINKKPSLKPLQPLLGVADGLTNAVNDLRLNGHKTAKTPYYTAIPEVDEATATFIAGFQQDELFRRNREDLNWITQYPWLRQGTPDEEARKYYFSSVSEQFQQQHILIKNEQGETIAYLLYTLRDGHLKLPYVYVAPDNINLVAAAVVDIALQHKVTMLTTFHPLLTSYFMKNKGPAIFAKALKRYYLVSKKLMPYVNTGPNRNFMDGDGDQAFT